MEFKELIRTLNQGDIAFIKSLLEAEGIEYYLHGEHFNLIRPLIEPARFMVREDQFGKAQELIKDLTISYGMDIRGSDTEEDNQKGIGYWLIWILFAMVLMCIGIAVSLIFVW